MTDKVTIIIPVYKVEKYIHECMDSLLNQSYRNLEIILVDDDSPGNCLQICDDYWDKTNALSDLYVECSQGYDVVLYGTEDINVERNPLFKKEVIMTC